MAAHSMFFMVLMLLIFARAKASDQPPNLVPEYFSTLGCEIAEQIENEYMKVS